MNKIIKKAQSVFDIEIEGLTSVRNNLGKEFEQLVEKCICTLNNGGKLVITGVGKSGYIGKKIAATLSSVGAPAVFMHPVEALHGDLGILQKNDLMLALSYSGETEELLSILSPAKRLGMEIAAITGSFDSSLAGLSNLVVPMTVPKEACPFNLAPTTTTTALLALGDALALVLLDLRGFTREDYGRLHPGGAIGKAVTVTVADIMRSGDKLALVTPESSVKDTLLIMTHTRCGCAIVVDANKMLLGIFTDGDFRRHAEKDIHIINQPITKVMTKNPITISSLHLAVEALKIIEDRHINSIVVVSTTGQVVGFIDVQDLPKFKLM
jgi:arabinose-5-phosphate isomerase